MENAAKEILFGNAAQRLRCLTVLDMWSILPQPISFDIPEFGGIRRPNTHCPYGPGPDLKMREDSPFARWRRGTAARNGGAKTLRQVLGPASPTSSLRVRAGSGSEPHWKWSQLPDLSRFSGLAINS
jgi:hypothetical protein